VPLTQREERFDIASDDGGQARWLASTASPYAPERDGGKRGKRRGYRAVARRSLRSAPSSSSVWRARPDSFEMVAAIWASARRRC